MAESFAERVFHPEVRDLVWAWSSPGLLNADFPAYFEKIWDDESSRSVAAKGEAILRGLDAGPELWPEIEEQLGGAPLLGRYFEALLSAWVKRVIVPWKYRAGLIVKGAEKKGSLGELDLVLQRTEESPVEHWEATVKFYLCYVDHPGVSRPLRTRDFLGTQTRDRLDLKLARLFGHQLGLSHRPEGRAALLEAGFDPSLGLKSLAIARGMLFYPAESEWKEIVLPEEISPSHLRGWWTSVDRWNVPAQKTGSEWWILPRHRWLSPARVPAPAGVEVFLELRELKEALQSRAAEGRFSSAMVAEVAEGREIARGVIVRASWLQEARDSASLLDLDLQRLASKS